MPPSSGIERICFSMKKKKLLFVISTLTGGGAERALCNLSLALEDRADVDILINNKSPEDYPHGGRVITLGIPFKKHMSLAYQIKALFKRIKVLKKLKEEGGYDACISFMDSANYTNVLADMGRKKSRCKTIVSIRVTLSECRSWKYRYLVRPMARIFYPHAGTIVTVSKESGKDLVDHYGIKKKNLRVIYNGNDLDRIRRLSEKECPVELEDDKFYFFNLGRMTISKGQWHLIRAFKEVVKVHPRARLLICGDGEYREYLESLIKGLSLEDHVILAGFHNNPYAIMRRCQVFVSASVFEGFSNALVEGLAVGMPVLSTDFPSSAREILAPDTPFEKKQTEGIEEAKGGILIPVCSGVHYKAEDPLEKQEEILGKAMIRLIEDDELRMRYAGGAKAHSALFSMESMSEKWLSMV